MVPTAAPANAAAVSTAERAAAPTTQVVMKNEFGKARSLVTGTFGAAGTATGTFTPKRFFVNDDGVMMVAGVVKAKLTRASGKVEGVDRQRVRTEVVSANGAALGAAPAAAGARAAAQAAECDVLNLVLGPLDLNLLGLQVSLDTVVLDIIAVSGAGNLLGNLLCAVAGLLDGGLPGLLGEISNILNAILAILRL
ncbi:ABC transporter substrate-binding protein [Nocardioides sp. HDW12B]|uniref:ABC transporter substrate-binding protein n=1 Tax=Nocardioides sp. HDW12B TaxID=2714939 RepID=UPI00140901FF|nr:ABC transporter substrate-binding protein [Nocardioides sp. HDW12B]QIK65516.1 ABC transporter substrate-binding protein [Nocardioides sp. HDW12B]